LTIHYFWTKAIEPFTKFCKPLDGFVESGQIKPVLEIMPFMKSIYEQI